MDQRITAGRGRGNHEEVSEMILEKDIEQYLLKRCRERGWYAPKFTSPGRRSVPDRMIVMPGRIAFVELKAPGKKATPKQLWEHDRLDKYGYPVAILDTKEGVDKYLEEQANINAEV